MLRLNSVIIVALLCASLFSSSYARPRRQVDMITGEPVYTNLELEQRCN